MLTELGWPMTADDVVRRFLGGSSDSMLVEIERHLGADRTADFDRRSTEEIVAAFHAELQPIDGVRDVIESLHDAGTATCVASSGSHRKMELTLGLTDLRKLFEGRIFSSSEVERGKPAPDLFIHAARAMGVEPRLCVVVEDSINGVRAAVAAEMTCYGFAGGLTARDDLAGAGAITFDTMTELSEWLLPHR